MYFVKINQNKEEQMTVLVIAKDPEKMKEVRKAVLQALQDKGNCCTVSHEDGLDIFVRLQPDLIIVCDYDEEVTRPTKMAYSSGFRSYCRIKEFVSEHRMIRMGDKEFGHVNYCNSEISLKELVCIH